MYWETIDICTGRLVIGVEQVFVDVDIFDDWFLVDIKSISNQIYITI
jgi:hypothetical protein